MASALRDDTADFRLVGHATVDTHGKVMLKPADPSPKTPKVSSLAKGHPHPGQRYRHGWIPIVGGDIIHTEHRKYGKTPVHISSHTNGDRTLTFPESGRSVRLTEEQLMGHGRLRHGSMANTAESALFDHQGNERANGAWTALHGPYRELHDDNGKVRAVTADNLIEFRKAGNIPDSRSEDDEPTGRTPVDVHIPLDDSEEGVDSPPAATMTPDQVRDMAWDAYRTVAHREDTGTGGHLDVIKDGTDVILRPGSGGEWRFNRRSARRVHQAWKALVDDEGRDTRPDHEAESKVVDTNLGPVTVTMTGENRVEFSAPGHPTIRIAPGVGEEPWERSYDVGNAWAEAADLDF